MATFLLVRHGSPLYELAEERRLRGGARDWVPLSPKGIAEVEQAAERLRGTSASLILSSPMTRAVQTAAILSRALDLPLLVEFDLHEWLPDLSQSYDSVDVAVAADKEMECYGGEWPQGETRQWEPLSQVRRRVQAVLRRYSHLEEVIVVSHGTVISALTGQAVANAQQVIYHLPADGR
jgi:broad specificity phosphatase PhoE